MGSQSPRGSTDRDDGRAPLVHLAATPTRGDESTPLEWSRSMVEAVRRIDEFVVRYLDVSRCGVWTVSDDGQRAICVDLYLRDEHAHRRDEDRDGPGALSLHRRLEAGGVVGTTCEQSSAGLLPPATRAALAVALPRGDRPLAAYLCAEQTGPPREWNAVDQRFLRAMAEVLREMFAVNDTAAARIQESVAGERLPAVLYHAVCIGGAWTITKVSEGVERLLGLRAADLVGAPLKALRGLLADVPPALPSQGEFEHGYRRGKGDAQRYLSEKGWVGREPGGSVQRVEGLIVDITGSLKLLPDTAGQYALLGQMGHEMRTPLNAILGFAQLIGLDPQGSAGQRHEYLAQIRIAGTHLLDIVRDTVDVARLQSGQVHLQLRPLQLAQLVGSALPMVQHLGDDAGVQLSMDMPEPSLQAVADERALTRALVNLLSNAIKYNRRGGSVHVECVSRAGCAVLRVTDSGIGMSEAQRRALFQPFNRLGMERSDIEGVGLGLFITHQLVQAMGGEILVSSQPGVGSTFEVALPAHEPGGEGPCATVPGSDAER